MSKWRASREYRVWRSKVIRRDKTCQICNSRAKRQAHHINNGTHHPKDRFTPSNGVVLCSSCHRQLHTNYKYSYRMKTTNKDWDNFRVLALHYIKVGESKCS